MSTITGVCNCRNISVTIPTPKESMLCHCESCRKSCGSTYSANLIIGPSQLQVSGQPAQFKAIGTSGQNVTRNFCSNCGSPIFTTIDVDPSQVFVKAGLFPPGQVPKPTIHLFVKNMEDWEVAEEDTTKLETQ